jgi:hypothetical protein
MSKREQAFEALLRAVNDAAAKADTLEGLVDGDAHAEAHEIALVLDAVVLQLEKFENELKG